MEVFIKSGITITINSTLDIMHYTMAVPQKFENRTAGLLGYYNGIKADDLMDMNGMLYNISNESDVFVFGETCMFVCSQLHY